MHNANALNAPYYYYYFRSTGERRTHAFRLNTDPLNAPYYYYHYYLRSIGERRAHAFRRTVCTVRCRVVAWRSAGSLRAGCCCSCIREGGGARQSVRVLERQSARASECQSVRVVRAVSHGQRVCVPGRKRRWQCGWKQPFKTEHPGVWVGVGALTDDRKWNEICL